MPRRTGVTQTASDDHSLYSTKLLNLRGKSISTPVKAVDLSKVDPRIGIRSGLCGATSTTGNSDTTGNPA